MHTKFFHDLINTLNEYEPKSVAETSGVSLQTIYNWLNGSVRNPQLRTVFAIAKVLDIEITMIHKPVRSHGLRKNRHLRVAA